MSTSAKKPVIFWIHGGAFIFGGVPGFGAKYMLDQVNMATIVFVFHYRKVNGKKI